MGARELYDRIVGTPIVYDYVRPLVVGRIDMSPVYRRAEVTADDIVLDVGCGTGDALRYLTAFKAFSGFDIDEQAVDSARRRYAHRPEATFQARRLEESDMADLRPTVVLLVGLLHHLSDEYAVAVMRMLRNPGTVRRVVTQDIVYLEGEPVSNFLARLDRGRDCRSLGGYEALANEAGWTVSESVIIRSHPKMGLAKYLVMTLGN